MHGRGAGFRAPFDDRLAQADDPSVGVNLEEQPARLDEDGFEFRDRELLAGADQLQSALASFRSLAGYARRGGRLLRLGFVQRADGGRARGCSE